MPAAVLKALHLIKLLLNKDARKIGKKIVIVLLSPVIALIFIIGGIFSSGIQTNHSLIEDLYYEKVVNVSHMDATQRQHVKDIQNGIQLLNQEIIQINSTFNEGNELNVFLVKGFFIGFMFSKQYIVFDEEQAKIWVGSFVVTSEENKEQIVPTSDISIIYPKIEEAFGITLEQTTKDTMEKVYSGLSGSNSNGTVTTLTKEEIEKLIKNLPKDTSELRKNIVVQAADAVGKIPYYWGGYAVVPGYEGNDFGKVTTPDEHGRTLKGMDCSHFVDWVYWTVMGNNLGNTNTTGQIVQSYKITKDELLPGDLAFLMENGVSTHVGIYAGKNEKGEAVWIHENAADVNVAINTVNYWNLYCRLQFMKGR